MKHLTDITIEPATATKYTMSILIQDGDTTDAIVINGDEIDRLIDWAEWKITNTLCDFAHTKDNKIEDYEEVDRGV